MPPDRFIATAIEMLEELLALEKRMEAFYADLSASYSGPMFWEAPPSLTMINADSEILDEELTSCTNIQFQDIELARLLMLYWSTLSMVLSGLNDLFDAVQSPMLQHHLGYLHRPLAIQSRDWLDPIRRVCRSVRFCSLETGYGLG